MASAAYYREWRKNHPEYRAREGERRRARRARMTPEERRKDRGTRPSRLCGPVVSVPSLHQGHELFDRAREMARITNGFKYLTHPYYDDLISELVLGQLEGDPEAAQKAFLSRERAWLHKTISLRAWEEA